MSAHVGPGFSRRLAAVGAAVVLVAAAAAAEGRSEGDVRLRVVSQGGKSAISVELSAPDGAGGSQLVRETDAAVRPGASGSHERTLFVDWSENGERWFSYSADGGRSWAEARPHRDRAAAPGRRRPARQADAGGRPLPGPARPRARSTSCSSAR